MPSVDSSVLLRALMPRSDDAMGRPWVSHDDKHWDTSLKNNNKIIICVGYLELALTHFDKSSK